MIPLIIFRAIVFCVNTYRKFVRCTKLFIKYKKNLTNMKFFSFYFFIYGFRKYF